MAELKIAFFASHGGSNMQAIIDRLKRGGLPAESSLVISNNSGSGALERAQKEGIPAYHISSATHNDRSEFVSAITDLLNHHEINLIALAGYMKKLPDEVIDFLGGNVLNIHPALLPKFGGKGMYGINVHKAVIEAGENESGATVHLVNSVYDEGRILAQKKVPVLPGDSPESLAARVLKAEHELYPETIEKIAIGEIKI
jgi:phosphoribosylglycinamide formyltransferase-1